MSGWQTIGEIYMGKRFEKLTDYLDTFESPAGKWIKDEKNDGSEEHPIQLPFVSYSESVHAFMHEFYAFSESHPEYGLNGYREILEGKGIAANTRSLLEADVSEADDLTVLALIMCAIRAERFCDGVLLHVFESGAMERWLIRLKGIDDNG